MGPGTAPALCGPTRRLPPESSQAIEPPPAPIVCTSTLGRRSGIESISVKFVSSGTPSRMSAMSVLVPPMSKLTTFFRPSERAQLAAPTTPPARPDRTVFALWVLAIFGLSRPPLDCMTHRRDGILRSSMPASSFSMYVDTFGRT